MVFADYYSFCLLLQLNVKQLGLEDGRTIAAGKFGAAEEDKVTLELSPEEKEIQETLKVWLIEQFTYLVSVWLISKLH